MSLEQPATEGAKDSSSMTSIFSWKVLGFLKDSGTESMVEATDGAFFTFSEISFYSVKTADNLENYNSKPFIQVAVSTFPEL